MAASDTPGDGGPATDRPAHDAGAAGRDARGSADRYGAARSGGDRRGDGPRGARPDRPRSADRPGRDDLSPGRRDPRPDRGPADRAGSRREPGRLPIPESARASFVAEPRLPDDIEATDLDPEVRRDLRGLQKDTADSVARHLVAAGGLVDEDPELALEHARYARRRASRIAVVREAAGIAAYHAGEWAEALSELRAARRMGGGPVHVPVMADIERALGRPERAIDLARGPEAAELGTAERIELAIVAAGARRDLGEIDASVLALQIPELDPARREPWSARLFYAYADNLLAAGRESDAVQWFVHSADADAAGETDAARRIAEITGDELDDDLDDIAFGEEDAPAGPRPGAAAEPAQEAVSGSVPGAPSGDEAADEAPEPTDEPATDEPATDEPATEGVVPDGAEAGHAPADTGLVEDPHPVGADIDADSTGPADTDVDSTGPGDTDGSDAQPDGAGPDGAGPDGGGPETGEPPAADAGGGR